MPAEVVAAQTFTIPNWLPADLANARHHWSKRHAIDQEAAQMAYGYAKTARWAFVPGKVHLHIHYIFGVKRRRDVDNLTARSRGLINGLKGHFFEDDDAEHLTLAVSAEVQKGRTALIVTLEVAG